MGHFKWIFLSMGIASQFLIGPTTAASALQTSCGVPIVNGIECAAVCGYHGGTCLNCACFCKNLDLVGNIGGNTTAPFNPNCTVSSNATANAQCNCSCASIYPTIAGTYCSVPLIPSDTTDLTDICTCKSTSPMPATTNPPFNQLTCENMFVSSYMCATVCRYGGQCYGYNTCICNCPTKTNLTSVQTIGWALTDVQNQNRCPANQRVNNATMIADCKKWCLPGALYADPCMVVPPPTSILVNLFSNVLNDAVSGLGVVPVLCACTRDCGATTCPSTTNACTVS